MEQHTPSERSASKALSTPPTGSGLRETTDVDSFILEFAAEAGYQPEPIDGRQLTAMRPPLAVMTALRFLARKTPLEEAFIARILADVHAYLTVPRVRGAVIRAVAEAMTDPTPAVVVAHSLGSLVAVDYLNTATSAPADVPLLITAGSPLGDNGVRRRLLSQSAPPQVRRWVNASDRRDVVALEPKLSILDGHGHVEDEVTDNGQKAHSMAEYLSDPDVAGVVGETFGL